MNRFETFFDMLGDWTPWEVFTAVYFGLVLVTCFSVGTSLGEDVFAIGLSFMVFIAGCAVWLPIGIVISLIDKKKFFFTKIEELRK